MTIGSGDSKMTLDKDGLQAGKVKVSSEGIDAGGNRIQGVADGKEKDDAATVGQLAQVADAAGEAINSLGNHLSRLDTRINRVGAGAAALAALHPDPNGDDAWSISAGIGNYRNSTAAAIGAFYRPNDNMIVSMGATVGNGENMINAGVTVGIGSGVSRGPVSKAALVREISALKQSEESGTGTAETESGYAGKTRSYHGKIRPEIIYLTTGTVSMAVPVFFTAESHHLLTCTLHKLLIFAYNISVVLLR